MQILKSLRKRGVTILISSHVLSDLSDVCDRIGIMQKGKLVKVDKTEVFLNKEEFHRVRLKTADREEEAMNIVKAIPGVEEPLWDGNDIVFQFHKSKSELALINKKLVFEDIPVVTIQIEDETLENAYLEITSKESKLQSLNKQITSNKTDIIQNGDPYYS